MRSINSKEKVNSSVAHCATSIYLSNTENEWPIMNLLFYSVYNANIITRTAKASVIYIRFTCFIYRVHNYVLCSGSRVQKFVPECQQQPTRIRAPGLTVRALFSIV